MDKKRKMKAAVLFGPRDLRVVEKDIPIPNDEEVLIKVEACAICGSDIKIYEKPWDPHPSFGDYILGHEFSGTIVSIGKKVDEFITGDRVAIHVHKGCGRCENCVKGMYTACLNFGNIEKGHRVYGITVNGGFAQYVAVHINNIYKLPKNVSFEQATLVTNAACGLYGLEVSKSHIINETIFITGPGPIGLMVVQLCKSMGAKKVILTGTRDYRLNLGEKLGADNIININKTNVFEEIKHITNGRGVDLSVECSGKESSLSNCISVTKRGGKIILLGNYDELVTCDMSKVVKYHITMYGIRGEGDRACGRALILMSQGKIHGDIFVTHKFNLDEIERAFLLYKNRIGNPVKVIVYPNLQKKKISVT